MKAKTKAVATAVQAALVTLSFATLPILGGDVAGGGTFHGVITQKDGTHCAVVIMGIADKKASHADQVTWAKTVGGELAPRAVLQLLIVTMGLPTGWYWAAEEYGASTAWYCSSNGNQLIGLRSSQGGGVSVRLIPLVA